MRRAMYALPQRQIMKAKSIKLLHVLYSFDIGGLENGVVNLINESKDPGIEHHICCITKSGASAMRLRRSAPIHEMHKQTGKDWGLLPRLIGLMRRLRPDVVHTRNWGSFTASLAAALCRVPVTIHGEHGWNMDDPDGDNARRRLMRKALARWITMFVAVSEDIRRWLTAKVGINDGRVVKIINGVDSENSALPVLTVPMSDGEGTLL